MTIVPLQKVTLFGILEDKARVLEAAQSFGALHLIPLSPAQKELEAVPTGKGQGASDALRWLMSTPSLRRPISEPVSPAGTFNAEEVIASALENRTATLAAEDRRVELLRRIRTVLPWGEFSFEGLAEETGYYLWFYVIPVHRLKDIRTEDLQDAALEIVHRDRLQAHVVVISCEEPAADTLPVARMHVGEHSLSILDRQLEDVEVELEELELERIGLTKWRGLLGQDLAGVRDRAARHLAGLETADEDGLFVLQAWCPEAQVAEVEALAARIHVAAIFEAPTAEEDPPSLLQNRTEFAAGEDLVTFYQTPSYRDWDPSAIVYVSFILFFGMIMTDVGYGVVMLVGCLLLTRKFGRSPQGQRFRVMLLWLSVSTILFGVLTGSYFGIAPREGGVLAHLKIMDLSNVSVMMQLTITIGVAHVVLANVMRALHAKSPSGKFQPLGWALAAVGGLSAYLWPEASWGYVIAVMGLLGAAGFASDREVESFRTAGLRVLDGAAVLARAVNIFSDVLSYMRLFALGLAAASLAATINSLAHQLLHGVPGIGLLLAVIVLLIGHGINFGLGLIAGVVHGLRLNVIEFFNWGLKEEGTAFRPFRKEEAEP